MADSNAFGIAGLLGWPVAHSRSPVIHNHWLREHAISGRYVLFPVPPEKLSMAVQGLAALGLRGCNVTTPHKQAIMPLIDRVDELARRIGAVNTVVVESDGRLAGFNNDGNGFVQSLRDASPAWRPDAGPVTVLGAGGAARAVVATLAMQGAREIRIVNRTFERAAAIAHEFGSPVTAVHWEDRADALHDVALLATAVRRVVRRDACDHARAPARCRSHVLAPVAATMSIFDEPKIDCHVHVLDPAGFPYDEHAHYRPAGQETGTAAQLAQVMQAYGVRHALVVGPNSGYGLDSRCLLDALAHGRGRLKGIAVVRNDTAERELDALKAAGIVGDAWNATHN